MSLGCNWYLVWDVWSWILIYSFKKVTKSGRCDRIRNSCPLSLR
jgi:hypothetical protein